MVNHTSQVDERLHLPDGLSINCDWCVGSCVHLHQLGLLPVDLELVHCKPVLRYTDRQADIKTVIGQNIRVQRSPSDSEQIYDVYLD